MQQFRSMNRLGLVISVLFVLQGVMNFVRAVAFADSFRKSVRNVSSDETGFVAFIMRINTEAIVPLMGIVLVLFMISTQPRAWKAWVASFGAATLVLLIDWLLGMEGIFRIIVYVVFVASNVYAFFEFRRLLRSPETVQSAAGGAD